MIASMRYPSGRVVVAWLIASVIPLVWPLTLYVTLRYLTGHRADGSTGGVLGRMPKMTNRWLGAAILMAVLEFVLTVDRPSPPDYPSALLAVVAATIMFVMVYVVFLLAHGITLLTGHRADGTRTSTSTSREGYEYMEAAREPGENVAARLYDESVKGGIVQPGLVTEAEPVAKREQADGQPSPRSQAGPTAGGPHPETKVCPDCAEEVRAEARICRFCRHEFPVDVALDAAAVSPASEPVATPVIDQQSFGRWRIERTSKSFLPVGSAAVFVVSAKNVSMMIGDQMRFSTRASYVDVEAVGGGLRISEGSVLIAELMPLDGQDAVEAALEYRSLVQASP
jgi:hypothetical protein